MIMALARLASPLERLGIELVQSVLAAIRQGLAPLAALAALAGVGWLLAGRGLAGRRLALWCLVPALAIVALICLLGPGRLFSKALEGPILIPISENHAVTLSDLPGALCAAGAIALGCRLIALRLRRWRGGRNRDPAEGRHRRQ